MGKHLIWSSIPQDYSLGNVILGPKSFHTGRRIYKGSKSTHLSNLRYSERNFQGKKIKNRRSRRLAEEKRT